MARSPNPNAADVNDSGDVKQERSANKYAVDSSDRSPNINTNTSSSAAYESVDCTPLAKTSVLDKECNDNGERGAESQVEPPDGPLYFQLEKDNNKAGEIVVNANIESYDRLDHTAKPADYRQNGDEGAYQHIELQPT